VRLASIRIQNFRAFADETIRFNDYTCLVGPNGGGKSTVLTALNIFFRDTSHSQTDLLKLDKEDFHHKNIKAPITITVTFEDLSAEAQHDLKDYFRQGKLVVSASAKWNEEDKFAQVLQYGERLGMEDLKPFFKAEGEGASVADLKKHYATIRDNHADLPAPGTKQAMIDALRDYESAHADECVLIRSEDQFYGVSRGANRLEKYIQWVFVPAVKDACDEQLEAKKTALGMLLERTVRTKVMFKEPLDALRTEFGGKYQAILDAQQSSLKELSDSLTRRLGEWAHPDTSLKLEWQNDQLNSIKIAEPLAQIIAGEGDFKGKLARFGHGLQRSFLLALLEELSGCDAAAGPKLILGCEEPELYQHPPQARHLASVIQKLTTKNSQVIVCTHSPYFVSGREVEDVRSLRPNPTKKACSCHCVTLGQIAESIGQARGEAPAKPVGTMLKVQQALQPALNEIFFTNVLILVEGMEDIAYVSTYITLMECWDQFRKLGCHLVPAGGKSYIAQPLAIAQHLKIPTFVLFDSDGHKVPKPGEADKNGRRAMHEKDNTTILKLCGVTTPDPFPAATLWQPGVVMWKSEMDAMVRDDFGSDDWSKIADSVRAKHGIDVGDINKNSLFIGYRLMEAWEQNKKSPMLERLCNAIIDFATNARNAAGPAKPVEAVKPAETAK
jgi:energy-coupling factor transporter ATP-binding protein EcfA2